MQTLAEVRDPGDIVVEEAPSARRSMHDYLPIDARDTFYTMASGGLGYGLPAAVGVALARPGARVIGLIGDGSAMYSIQALWSAAQLKLPITFVILNNRRYAALQEFAPDVRLRRRRASSKAPTCAASTSSPWRAAWASTTRCASSARRRCAMRWRRRFARRRRRWSRSSSPESNRPERPHEDRPPRCPRPVDPRALPAGLAPRLALAQAWPDKPILIVVGFPPGGAADQNRPLSSVQPLQDALGQPIVVENRTGAGWQRRRRGGRAAAPDGYTLLMSSGGMVSVNPHIYPKMTF